VKSRDCSNRADQEAAETGNDRDDLRDTSHTNGGRDRAQQRDAAAAQGEQALVTLHLGVHPRLDDRPVVRNLLPDVEFVLHFGALRWMI
jgi:hypothetical protein